MPFYDLSCSNCGNVFNIRATMKERENKEIKCPKCSSNELETVFKSVQYVIKSGNGCENRQCPHAQHCNSEFCHR
jgi:putative FmdB family regulatory protein